MRRRKGRERLYAETGSVNLATRPPVRPVAPLGAAGGAHMAKKVSTLIQLSTWIA